jgi:primase-polymerase (primpol)-like protein
MGKFLDLPPALNAYAGLPIWVIWKLEFRPAKSKWTKVPYCAFNPNRKAKCNDPSTWAPYSAALSAFQASHGDGIGFVIRETDFGCRMNNVSDPTTRQNAHHGYGSVSTRCLIRWHSSSPPIVFCREVAGASQRT